MGDTQRYLLPTERAAIEQRRHWAVLAGLTTQTILLLAVGITLASLASASAALRTMLVYFILLVILRWGWSVLDWYVEKLIVTDKRVLLITGLISRRVAIMPLVKVTDLTYRRSPMGILLGYGEFVFESAGQDQALSRIPFIPNPEKLYMQISELLFGGDKGAPGTLAEFKAEMESGRKAARRNRFGAWRRRRPRPAAPVTRDEAPTGRIDDLLAHRDTLLAEREHQYEQPEYETRYDEPPRYGDDHGIAYPPRPDSTGELPPIIHEPRRDPGRDTGTSGGSGHRTPPSGPTPPLPRPGRGEPPRPAPGAENDPYDD